MCRIVVNSTDWMKDKLSKKSWTIFAFPDDAFKSLGENRTISADAETKITEFHIVKYTMMFVDDLVCTDEIKMYNGERSRTVCRNDTKGQKGGGNKYTIPFRTTDLKAANGVVHILDDVLLDQNINATAPLFWDGKNIHL